MIWLIGNKGMLGSQLEKALTGAGLEVIGTDREIDMTDAGELEKFAAGVVAKRPEGAVKQPAGNEAASAALQSRSDGGETTLDWIVNCAAYTAVDKAESERDAAQAINTLGVENVAGVAAMLNSKLLHFSTDYVFSGLGGRPLKETDPTGPLSVYGRTKLEGERLLAAETDKYFILRLSWLYGVAGPNFVKTMIRLMREKDVVRVVKDQRGQPTYVGQLIRNVVKLVAEDSNRFGVYHYGDEGDINWYDFAVEIERQALECGALDRKVPVEAITTAEYPTAAVRPAYSVFDKTKVKTELGFEVRDWKANLAEYFAEWKKTDFK